MEVASYRWVPRVLTGLLVSLLWVGALSAGALPDRPTDYYGVVTVDSQVMPLMTGFIEVRVRKGGAFTGKLDVGAKPRKFKGRMDELGSGITEIEFIYNADTVYGYDLEKYKRELGVITLQLNDSATGLTGQIEYKEVYGGQVLAIEALAKTRKAGRTPVGGAGKYPFVLRDSEDGWYPDGAASGLLTVKPNGRSKIVGRMADGRRFAMGTWRCEGGRIPIFEFLRKPRGILQGWLQVGDTPEDLGGQLDWNTVGPLDDPPDPVEAYRVLWVEGAP